MERYPRLSDGKIPPRVRTTHQSVAGSQSEADAIGFCRAGFPNQMERYPRLPVRTTRQSVGGSQSEADVGFCRAGFLGWSTPRDGHPLLTGACCRCHRTLLSKILCCHRRLRTTHDRIGCLQCTGRMGEGARRTACKAVLNCAKSAAQRPAASSQ